MYSTITSIYLTSRGRRTENMPPSCDMTGATMVLQVCNFQLYLSKAGLVVVYVVVDLRLACPSARCE